jgi:PilZ domain
MHSGTAMHSKFAAVERSHLLSVGTLARIELDDSIGHLDIEGTISAVDDKRVTVRFRQLTQPIAPRLSSDHVAVLKVWDRFGMHRAEATVHAVIEEGGNAAVIVAAPSRFLGTQTRRFFRVSARLGLTVERMGGESAPPPIERTLSWDISAGGLSFLSDNSFEVNDRVAVTMVLPQEVVGPSGDLPRFETRVVRSEAIAETTRRFFGVEFQNITQRQRDRLVEVVLGLQRIIR